MLAFLKNQGYHGSRHLVCISSSLVCLYGAVLARQGQCKILMPSGARELGGRRIHSIDHQGQAVRITHPSLGVVKNAHEGTGFATVLTVPGKSTSVKFASMKAKNTRIFYGITCITVKDKHIPCFQVM